MIIAKFFLVFLASINAYLSRVENSESFLTCEVEIADDQKEGKDLEQLAVGLVKKFERLQVLNKKDLSDTSINLKNLKDPSQIANNISSNLNIQIFEKQELLEIVDLKKRLEASYSIISLDTSYSSQDKEVISRPPEVAPFYLSEKENLKLTIFVDKSVVEVFINERQCIASRLYPTRKDSVGVSVISQGSSSKILSLDAYEMENIYKK